MVRYHYREGVTFEQKKRRWFLYFIGFIIIAAAAYVLVVYLAPRFVSVPFLGLTPEATQQKIQASKAGQYGDHLFIPQINVDVAIASGGGSDSLVDGAWQRNPSLGDPAQGGNFALSAYQFTLDTTPWWTRAKSPFYNLSQLRSGDHITVDYKNVRYIYQVEKTVEATSAKLEQKTDQPTLTLYGVQNSGDVASGVAVIAKKISPVTQADSGSN